MLPDRHPRRRGHRSSPSTLNTFQVAGRRDDDDLDTFVVNRPSRRYYYCLKVDSNDALTEVFEDNNTRCTDNRYIIGVDFDGT